MCLLVWNLAYASFLFQDNEMLYTKNKVDSRPEKQTEQTMYSKKNLSCAVLTLSPLSFSSKRTLCVSMLASVEAMLPRMNPNISFPATITAMA